MPKLTKRWILKVLVFYYKFKYIFWSYIILFLGRKIGHVIVGSLSSQTFQTLPNPRCRTWGNQQAHNWCPNQWCTCYLVASWNSIWSASSLTHWHCCLYARSCWWSAGMPLFNIFIFLFYLMFLFNLGVISPNDWSHLRFSWNPSSLRVYSIDYSRRRYAGL